MESADCEKKLAHCQRQYDYWHAKKLEEWSAHAAAKEDYWEGKVQYWRTRIGYCQNPANPCREEREGIAQQLRNQ